MPALAELEGCVSCPGCRCRIPGRAGRSAAHLCRPAHRVDPCPAADGTPGRRADLPQAGGSGAFGRAQDQQRAGPGAARPQHGQAADHRRDRRRAARRRHCHRVCAVGAGVRRLHGQRRHGPPAAERPPHAAAGRGGARGRQRHAHAEGRGQRSDPRLGDQRRRHLLPARLGVGAAPVSDHGARLPVGDRRRGARTDPGRPGACPMRASRASAAARTPSACSTRSGTMRACA